MKHSKVASVALAITAMLLAIVELFHHLTPDSHHGESSILMLILLVSLLPLQHVRCGARNHVGRVGSRMLITGLAALLLATLAWFAVAFLSDRDAQDGLTNTDAFFLYLLLGGVWLTAAVVIVVGAIRFSRQATLLPFAGIWTFLVGFALDFSGYMSNVESWGMLACATGLALIAVAAWPPGDTAPQGWSQPARHDPT